MVRRVAAAALATVLAIVSTGCGSDTPAASNPPRAPGAITGRVTVFAAASLTGAFTQLGKDFESTHPGVTVTFFAALAESGVNIEMISTSEIRISVVTRVDDVDTAVRAVHTAFGLDSSENEAVVYGGTGR